MMRRWEAYYSTEIAAGATVSSSSNKVGFGKQPSISVGESNVIAVNCAGPSTGDELNYELTGRKDVAYADTPVGRHGKLSVQKVDSYAAPIMVDQNAWYALVPAVCQSECVPDIA